jgi:hypothetical protein
VAHQNDARTGMFHNETPFNQTIRCESNRLKLVRRGGRLCMRTL